MSDFWRRKVRDLTKVAAVSSYVSHIELENNIKHLYLTVNLRMS
jgi:hypothetical protein